MLEYNVGDTMHFMEALLLVEFVKFYLPIAGRSPFKFEITVKIL